MKLRKRLILNRVITFVLGVAFICLGIFKGIETFIPMGVAMSVCCVLQLIKQWKVLFNDKKLKELENMYNDERTVFIANKSYSFSFWVSVYAEFIGMVVVLYMGLENISVILGGLICFQTFIYVVSNMFYQKRY